MATLHIIGACIVINITLMIMILRSELKNIEHQLKLINMELEIMDFVKRNNKPNKLRSKQKKKSPYVDHSKDVQLKLEFPEIPSIEE